MDELKCILFAFALWCAIVFFVSLLMLICICPENIVGICLSFTFAILSAILFAISNNLKK